MLADVLGLKTKLANLLGDFCYVVSQNIQTMLL